MLLEINDGTYAKLQQIAVPLRDTADSVINRLIESYQTRPSDLDQFPINDPLARATSVEVTQYTNRRPAAFTFQQTRRVVSTFKQIYVELCEQLAKSHSHDFRRVLDLRGRKRSFFSLEPRGLTQPQFIESANLYAETNFSAENIVERCHALLRLFSYSLDSLNIEMQASDVSPPRDSPTEKKDEEKMTWVNSIRTALTIEGGKASLFDLYRLVPPIRGGNTPNTYDAIIRGTIENHSSDSKNFRPGNPDYFYSVGGIGSGIWGIR